MHNHLEIVVLLVTIAGPLIGTGAERGLQAIINTFSLFRFPIDPLPAFATGFSHYELRGVDKSPLSSFRFQSSIVGDIFECVEQCDLVSGTQNS